MTKGQKNGLIISLFTIVILPATYLILEKLIKGGDEKKREESQSQIVATSQDSSSMQIIRPEMKGNGDVITGQTVIISQISLDSLRRALGPLNPEKKEEISKSVDAVKKIPKGYRKLKDEDIELIVRTFKDENEFIPIGYYFPDAECKNYAEQIKDALNSLEYKKVWIATDDKYNEGIFMTYTKGGPNVKIWEGKNGKWVAVYGY